MHVDTPSADDEQVDGIPGGSGEDALAAAVAAAEGVLANRFGSPIKLAEPEDLAGSGPAVVVRVRVVSSPFSLPKTLVIKHYRGSAGQTPDPFATEAASYQLFTALTSEQRMCPEPIGHDGKLRVLVLSDLGRAPTLEDKLRTATGDAARVAERALLSWARALGRVHATTARREADFNALLRRLGGTGKSRDAEASAAVEHLPGVLREQLGVDTPAAVLEQVAAAVGRATAGRFRAFSPVDLSPENNLVTGSGVRFLDFEHGCVRNALIDVAHLRAPFAFWSGALGLPAGMSDAMIAAWRSEVLPTWPKLADEEAFAAGLLDSQLLCVWSQTAGELPTVAAGSANRPPALESWWRELSRQAATSGADEVAEHSGRVAAALDDRFGPDLELPMYQAFR